MRPRTVKVVAYNIALASHTPEKYVELFAAIKKLNRAFRLEGDRFAQLVTATETTEQFVGVSPTRVVLGTIATFLKINVSGPWHNMETGEEASDEDKAGLVMKQNLGPNRRRFSYKFYVDKHHLVVQTRSLDGTFGARSIDRFLRAAVSAEEIAKVFGDVAVTQVPDKSVISKILSSDLVCLDIKITVPNPDENQAAENTIRKRMDARRAKSEQHTVIAERGQTLQLDADLRAEAMVAAQNGVVVGTVQQGTKRTTISTKETPLVKTGEYYPSQQETERDGFDIASNKIYAEIASPQSDAPNNKG